MYSQDNPVYENENDRMASCIVCNKEYVDGNCKSCPKIVLKIAIFISNIRFRFFNKKEVYNDCPF